MKARLNRTGSLVGGILFSMAVVLASGLPGNTSRAQTGPTSEQVLKEELEKARHEIERLKEENARLKGKEKEGARALPENPNRIAVPSVPPPSSPAVPATTSSAVGPGPSGSNAVVGGGGAGTVVVPAPIAEGEKVTAEQVLADYRTSAVAGDARYKGRKFRVEGPVQSFKKVFAGMTWDVRIQSQEKLGVLRCRVTFPGVSDFRGEGGSILEGRRPFREWQLLLAKGENFAFEGTCEGLDGAVIVFKDARPSKP